MIKNLIIINKNFFPSCIITYNKNNKNCYYFIETENAYGVSTRSSVKFFSSLIMFT